MSDLISRAAALDVINTWGRQKSEKVRMGLLHRDLDAIPAVDAATVVHGQWLEKRWTTECDWCVINHRALVCTACSVEIANGEETPYCPYCGAKMDKEART